MFSTSTQFLMPGPLVSGHSAISDCTACHTKSGQGNLSWIRGLVAGDPHDDSKACLSCHQMPETALNPHGASASVLEQSTKRMTKIAARVPAPQSARVQSAAFPTKDMIADGLTCATCHQEHQGSSFDLNKISNAQCRSCHVVKFDSFDGDHPKFDGFPFQRRTRIIYDHAAHFDKHYPELKEKALAKHIPKTCSTCHNTNDNKKVMAVAPFANTCTACHLNQILGTERASGPKGIAFLALPGLDLERLNTQNAAVGEWPEDSEAALTPFMKVMISRTTQGRDLIQRIDGLNLLDLSRANEAQLKAVTNLVWEIKRLLHALIAGKASDVLGDLNIVRGAKLSPKLVADLTASIPRDVLIRAQQQWLPNLATEISSGPMAKQDIARQQTQSQSRATERGPDDVAPVLQAATSDDAPPDLESDSQQDEKETAPKSKLDPPACLVSVLGQCLMYKDQGEGAPPSQPQQKGVNGNSSTANADTSDNAQPPPATALPAAMQAGLKQVKPPAAADGATAGTRVAQAGGSQSDDLLVLSDDERRAMKALNSETSSAAEDQGVTSHPSGALSAPAATTPVVSIASDVDPESWAEYGGWYGQDHTIYYRPVGHKDKFIYSWLFLTGPQAPRGVVSPAGAVFDFLIHEDTPGSCTKCHSVDDIQGKGRVVNFAPPSTKHKQGRFTNFLHEPHFGVLDDRGCLHCHDLKKGQPYLKNYKHGDPKILASNFAEVEKDLCQSCHTQNKVRQDCLTCHTYHVHGVSTPILNTKIPNR